VSADDLVGQARLLHALGEGDGAVALTNALAAVPPAERAGLHTAVAALEERGLLELGGDGVLRPGRRGSLLSAARVRERRRDGRYGATAEVHAVVDSTNDEVLARAVAGAGPGVVVAAELQTAGRGTKGRTFLSPPGLGVWSTTLLDAPADPSVAPRYSLVAALAAAAALERETGVPPSLKWPNDVRLGGRKVCGVLVEARSIAGQMFLVAGIGCNVHHRSGEFPPELRELAGSVEERTGRRVDRSALLASLVAELETLVTADRNGGIDLAARWARFDELADCEVEVRLGDEVFFGRADGIEDDGRLRVRSPGGETRTVRSAHATVAARIRERAEGG
jgi:BirA family biotin operon repressor/biotin-[acetyl-CoA-carboxylase] ligase